MFTSDCIECQFWLEKQAASLLIDFILITFVYFVSYMSQYLSACPRTMPSRVRLQRRSEVFHCCYKTARGLRDVNDSICTYHNWPRFLIFFVGICREHGHRYTCHTYIWLPVCSKIRTSRGCKLRGQSLFAPRPVWLPNKCRYVCSTQLLFLEHIIQRVQLV